MFSVSKAYMQFYVMLFLSMQIRCSTKSNIDFLNIARFNEDKFIQILTSREKAAWTRGYNKTMHTFQQKSYFHELHQSITPSPTVCVTPCIVYTLQDVS